RCAVHLLRSSSAARFIGCVVHLLRRSSAARFIASRFIGYAVHRCAVHRCAVHLLRGSGTLGAWGAEALPPSGFQ
ncbi:hypothetical protein RZS08_65750, partial [Arthrospira platensis SPKY1]|nr:hypothetical protein [Arthrospira platensis SPKY1]